MLKKRPDIGPNYTDIMFHSSIARTIDIETDRSTLLDCLVATFHQTPIQNICWPFTFYQSAVIQSYKSEEAIRSIGHINLRHNPHVSKFLTSKWNAMPMILLSAASTQVKWTSCAVRDIGCSYIQGGPKK